MRVVCRRDAASVQNVEHIEGTQRGQRRGNLIERRWELAHSTFELIYRRILPNDLHRVEQSCHVIAELRQEGSERVGRGVVVMVAMAVVMAEARQWWRSRWRSR